MMKNLKQDLKDIAAYHRLRPELLKDTIYRLSKGYTQKEIAEHNHVNPNTITRYVRIIKREMTTKEVLKILMMIVYSEMQR